MKWIKQRDKSIKERFNDNSLNGDSPTIGIIWDEKETKCSN